MSGDRKVMAARVAELKAEGLNGLQIAGRLGISRSYAYELINDPEGLGVARRKRSYSGTCESCGGRTDGSNGRQPSPLCIECHRDRHAERNARIFEAWERGETAPVIAVREGMSATGVTALVSHYRRKKGLALPHHRLPNRTRWPEVERLWHEGLTGPEIAARLGTTPGNVYEMVKAMREAGIDLPRRQKQAA